MELTGERLTLFLVKMFDGQEKNLLKKADRPTVPGSVQYGHHEDDLWFLETRLGSIWRGTSQIIVYQGADRSAMIPVWHMTIDRRIDEEAIASQEGISKDRVLQFIQQSRRQGFERAHNVITRLNTHLEPKDKLPFSIFDIPRFDETVKNKYGHEIGVLRYEEDIDDDISFFSGGEEIRFHPSNRQRSILLAQHYIQGGRLP
jgi:hypothetical protein